MKDGGDLNGDGWPDLAVDNRNSQTVSVLLNAGNGTFLPKSDFATGGLSAGNTLADFNKDNRLDLVVGLDGAKASVLLGNGNGSFHPFALYATGGTNQCFPIVADFNRDRRPDIATTSCNDNTSSVLLGNGNGTFQAPLSYVAGTADQAIVAGDLNNDRYSDVVVTDQASSTAVVLINDANWTSPIRLSGSSMSMRDEKLKNTSEWNFGFASGGGAGRGVDSFIANAVRELDVAPVSKRASVTLSYAGALVREIEFASVAANVGFPLTIDETCLLVSPFR